MPNSDNPAGTTNSTNSTNIFLEWELAKTKQGYLRSNQTNLGETLRAWTNKERLHDPNTKGRYFNR